MLYFSFLLICFRLELNLLFLTKTKLKVKLKGFACERADKNIVWIVAPYLLCFTFCSGLIFLQFKDLKSIGKLSFNDSKRSTGEVLFTTRKSIGELLFTKSIGEVIF